MNRIRQMPVCVRRGWLVMCSALLLSGCASTEYVASERDPWQGYNRAIYSFNDGLDKAILKPAAQGYQTVMPDFAETGVRNFFENLDDISVAVNNLLQGKVGHAFSDLGRVVVNTTIGVLGLFDVASGMGLEKHNEDFGQTLAVWGADSGPYIVWPFFGSSTLRDSPSIIIDDIYLDPLTYVELKFGERAAIIALDAVSLRAELLSLEETAADISIDQYTLIRDAYLDRREFLIKDGAVPADTDFYEGLEDDEEDEA